MVDRVGLADAEALIFGECDRLEEAMRAKGYADARAEIWLNSRLPHLDGDPLVRLFGFHAQATGGHAGSLASAIEKAAAQIAAAPDLADVVRDGWRTLGIDPDTMKEAA